MKNKFKLLSLLLIANGVFAQQNPTNTNPSGVASGGISQLYWSRAGNNNINGYNNIFGTLWNSPIYTVTDSTQRMVLMGSNPTNGISGALGLGTNLTNPQAFLHVANNFSGPFTGNGRLFRTDGLSTVSNSWSMWLTNNAGASVVTQH